MYFRSSYLTYSFDVQVRLDSAVGIQFECLMSNFKYKSDFQFGNARIQMMLLFGSAAERRASDSEEKRIILETDDELCIRH